VLWNGPALGPVPFNGDARAFVAGSVRQFEDLWQEVGRPLPVPAVDFARYVAFGLVRAEAPCIPEISAVEVQGETLTLDTYGFSGLCNQSLVGTARVIAVPRAVLPPRVTLLGASHGHAFRFKSPTAERASRERWLHSPARPEASAMRMGPSLGTVTLPARSSLALRELADGSEIWVVHDHDGSVPTTSRACRPAASGRTTGPRGTLHVAGGACGSLTAASHEPFDLAIRLPPATATLQDEPPLR
jgi:hypothetical protein